MRLKLDENLAESLAGLLRSGSHDVETVRSEALSGSDDFTLFEACKKEQRILVTLDLDFSNVLRFPPERLGGLIILRPPRQSLPSLRHMLTATMTFLSEHSPGGSVWIVEPGRIRIHETREEE